MKIINTQEFRPEGILMRRSMGDAWEAFMGGGSSHSEEAIYLTHIINRCEGACIPYCLNASPGKGYYIMPLKETDNRWRGI